MTDFQHIYAHQADQYDRLVAREDYQGQILAALQRIRPLAGLDVVEFGAGTGRLTRLLAPLVRSIQAFDASAAMLQIAAQTLEDVGRGNWTVGVADNRRLPVEDAVADLAIAGWSFGHTVGWFPDTWREEIGQMLAEMRRVLRPGGTAVILETLGTGRETPQPPHAGLAAYYQWLEGEQGFAATWIRTDYQFASLAEADELTRFFFGADLADRIAHGSLTIVPECTGLWTRHKET